LSQKQQKKSFEEFEKRELKSGYNCLGDCRHKTKINSYLNATFSKFCKFDQP